MGNFLLLLQARFGTTTLLPLEGLPKPIHDWANWNACLQLKQSRDKAYADCKTQPLHFEVGQWVLLSLRILYIRKADFTKELFPHFIGPVEVLKKVGKQAYELPP